MSKNVNGKYRDSRCHAEVKRVSAGIEQYQSMIDTPVFIIAIDGSFYQLDKFSSPQLKRLDCRV
jgi:hypothetical protein|tara:strand:+ start:218 stop:409 length:192 start_codon:yes stop_codon:yes gene_type:complete